MFEELFGDQHQPSARPAGIERGPLREDKIFLTADEQYRIGEHLQDAYSALDAAIAVWREIDRAEQGYCDEGPVQELDNFTLDALRATERAWKLLCTVTDAHETQLRDAEDAADHPGWPDDHHGDEEPGSSNPN
jgi:hypothetical protein